MHAGGAGLLEKLKLLHQGLLYVARPRNIPGRRNQGESRRVNERNREKKESGQKKKRKKERKKKEEEKFPENGGLNPIGMLTS